jgi:hypothetical protein
MSVRIEPTLDDLALARAWGSAFDSVFTTLERCVGFTLLPVVVPDARVARALSAALDERGQRTTVFAPQSESDWDEFSNFLLDGSSIETVTVLIATGSSTAQRQGLWLVNRQREAYLRTHPRPLLWCVDEEALRVCSEEAPDLWSIQATPKFIRPPQAATPSIAPDSRSLDELLALIDDGTCVDPSVWLSLSTACEAGSEFADAAYCAESAAFFSDGDARATALDRAMRLRVELASATEDGEWVRAFAESPNASGMQRASALDGFTGPAARAVAAIIAREGHAGRASRELFAGGVLQRWVEDARVGHRARANAIRFASPPRVLAMQRAANANEWLRARFERERDEQRRLVERLRALVPAIEPTEGGAIRKWEPHFIEALFDIARARLSAMGSHDERAELPTLSEEELAAGSPNELLLALIRARAEFDGNERGDWARRYIDERERRSDSTRARDRAELFTKRSRWLRARPVEPIWSSWRHRELEQRLASVLETPSTAAARLHDLFANTMDDYERLMAIERVVDAVVQTCDQDTVNGALRDLIVLPKAIAILGYRAQAIGAIARLVTVRSQLDCLQMLMCSIEQLIAQREQTLSTRDLVSSVRPVLDAARTIEAIDDAASFTARIRSSLAEDTKTHDRDSLRLRAVLAGSEPHTAETLSDVLTSSGNGLDFNGRYDVAREVLDAARSLPVELREPIVTRALSDYASFGDYFTTQRFYATYRLLIVEGALDTAIAPTPTMTRFVARSARTSAEHLDARG